MTTRACFNVLMGSEPDEAALRAAHCWFALDRIPGDPITTAWKRKARLRQSSWRTSRGYPVGTEPYAGGSEARPVGSRLPLEYAKETGANFLTPGALVAVRQRLAAPEPYQTLRTDRLWADLLSSMPLCFNLFGDVAGDEEAAARAVRLWWPDAPCGRARVRFEHSPGRRDPLFLSNQSAFDVAFEIGGDNVPSAIIGVETKYHEHARPEAPPRPAALARYVEVTERSGAFLPGWKEAVVGTELQQLWLDHLLVLSMLQHPSGRWTWGRFALVFPAENASFMAAAPRYAALLARADTFEFRTIEEIVAVEGVLVEGTRSALRDRYLASLEA